MSRDKLQDPGDWSPAAPADMLTIHVWSPAARRLREWATAAGADGIAIFAIALLAGGVAFLLFWGGHFGPGLVAAIAFLILGRASEPKGWIAWGPALVPLLWLWAWWNGLVAGHPLAPVYGLMVLWGAIAAGAADLAILKRFERRFGGVDLNDWRPVDARFALIATGPSTNAAMLAVGYILGRPGAALVVVAWWSIISVIFHAVRYAQASEQEARGKAISRWRQR